MSEVPLYASTGLDLGVQDVGIISRENAVQGYLVYKNP